MRLKEVIVANVILETVMRDSRVSGGRSLLATVAFVAFSLVLGGGCDGDMKGDAMLNFVGDDDFSEPLLTVQFRGMNPHIGQKLELRVVDQDSGREVGRKILLEIEVADFDLTLSVLLKGHSYDIDFYADLNGNGVYNAPPVDHAWRVVLSPAMGSDVVLFEHIASFTDIEWPAS